MCRIKIFTFSVLFLLPIFYGAAQHDTKYDSIYSPFKGLTGIATFDYYDDLDHLKVKNGDFSFTSNNSDSAWATVNEEQTWTGKYTENNKDGEWNYVTVNHALEVLSIEDDHLNYKLRTIRTELKANYKRGVPSGQWLLESEITLKDKAPEFYEKVSINFKKGYADGPFKYLHLLKDGSIGEIKGQFSKGLFNGEWVFTYFNENDKTKEKRQYSEGILTNLSKTSSITGKKEIQFLLSPQTQKVINEGGKSHFANKPVSMVFNDGFPKTSKYFLSQDNGNEILKHIHYQLLKYDKKWIKNQKFVFGANRGKYPLSNEDEKLITEWYRTELDFQLLVDDIKEHEIRDFGDSQDSIAQTSLAWINKQEDIFERISYLSQMFLSKEIEYYYRENLLLKNAIGILNIDSLYYNNQWHIVKYNTDSASHNNIFAFLIANFNQRTAKGKTLNALLSTLESSSSLGEELKQIPVRIREEQQKLDSLYAQSSKDKYTDNLLNHIKINFLEGSIKTQFEKFNTTKNKEDKKHLGDSILVDLNTISHIYNTSISIAQRKSYIDSLYTEYVFDAFTFSDNVPSRIKKRLFDQVSKIQLELIKKASVSNTPKACLEYIQEIYGIQGTLIFLKDQNTKALEKRLTKAKSIDDKIKLLHEVL